jgi:hypothetical protein
MGNKFSSGKYAISQCDRCGFRFKLKELRRLVIKTKNIDIKVCGECWEPDQPQLSLGMYPVYDPQAVREPRPDTTYFQAGLNGLETDPNAGPTEAGYGGPTQGSRIVAWGWNPVGFSNPLFLPFQQNFLVADGAVGTVTVTTS